MVGDAWHGDKCADDARGLENAIKILQKLAALPTAVSVRTEIDAAIKKAQDRLPGLRRGAELWRERSKSHPQIWDENGELRNKAK